MNAPHRLRRAAVGAALLLVALVAHWGTSRLGGNPVEGPSRARGTRTVVTLEPAPVPDSSREVTPRASEPEKVRVDPMREALAEYAGYVCSIGALWHLMDLSDWRTIDLPMRGWCIVASEKLAARGLTSTQVLEQFEGMRSVRMRQSLLLTAGLMGPGPDDMPALLRALDAPGLSTTAAFALGRLGTPAALDSLEARYHLERPGSRREGLLYGIAAAGAPALARLTRLTEEEAELRTELAADVYLGMIRDPAASPALREIAETHREDAVRGSAIHGFAMGQWLGAEAPTGWLAELVGRSGESDGLRVEAISELSMIDGPSSRALATELLADWQPPRVRAAALAAAGNAGLGPDGLAATLALATGDGELRHDAIMAIGGANEPAADAELARLLPGLDDGELAELVARLNIRGASFRGLEPGVIPFDPNVDSTMAPELLAALRERLSARDPAGGKNTMLVDLLVRHGELSRQEAVALPSESEDNPTNSLLRRAELLGVEAFPGLMDGFQAEPEFLERIRLASGVLLSPDAESPEAQAFSSEEVLPYLRTALLENTRAPIAFAGRHQPRGEWWAAAMAIAFGRHGEPADVELMDAAPAGLLESTRHWPEGARTVAYEMLRESCGRAADLITLRTAGSR